MASLNSVSLIGRVGKDPEVRTFDGGNKIASFTLATSEKYTDRNGQSQEATEWHNVVFNNKLADLAEKYIKKGSLLYVGGKIKTRSWQDQQGQKRYQTEIVGLSVQLLDSRPEASNNTQVATTTHRPTQSHAPQFQPQAPIAPPTPPQYKSPAPMYHAQPQYGPVDGPDLPF